MLETILLSVLFLAALAAIAVGAGMIYLPAGLIVGGALALATVGALARGGTPDRGDVE